MKKNLFLLFLLVSLRLFAKSEYFQEKSKKVHCKKPKNTYAFYYPKDFIFCPKNFKISADFLYMQVYEDSLAYAVLINKGFEKIKNMNFSPGARISFGYEKNFLVETEWTYLRHKNDSFASKTQDLLGTFYPPEAGTLTGASARLSLNFNTFDINIAKHYHVSRYYISCPKIGIQTAWINQNYHIRYFVTNIKQNVFCKNDFWGIGLKVGYDAEFLLNKKFSFYGNLATALLFSKFDISQKAQNISIYRYELEDSFNTVLPNAKIDIGIGYFKLKKMLKIQIKVGYELHEWWGINRFRRPMDTDPLAFKIVSRNNLTFTGFIASLNIDF